MISLERLAALGLAHADGRAERCSLGVAAKQCLREDRETEIVPSIHRAGQEFVQWFRSLWNDPDVPRNYLADLKTMLAQLYRASDRERADRLVNAIIEHLFETPEIAEFFSDWKSDPVLARGFARAMEWVERSPTQS